MSIEDDIAKAQKMIVDGAEVWADYRAKVASGTLKESICGSCREGLTAHGPGGTRERCIFLMQAEPFYLRGES